VCQGDFGNNLFAYVKHTRFETLESTIEFDGHLLHIPYKVIGHGYPYPAGWIVTAVIVGQDEAEASECVLFRRQCKRMEDER
jgi:hypothetical protein